MLCLAVVLCGALPVEVQAEFVYSTNAGGTNITITGYNGSDSAVVIPAMVGHLPVVKIGDYAFARVGRPTASDRLESVTIPESVMSIGTGAFLFCGKLTEIRIPADVTNIDDRAFNWCFGLRSIAVDAQNSAYCSVDGVLYDNRVTRLVQFPGGKGGAWVIPRGVTNIAHFALWNCPYLTSVTLPEGVASIEGEEFAGCGSLETVFVPASVTNIGPDAFNSCQAMKGIYFEGNAPDYGEPWRGGVAKVLGGLDTGTIYYRAGTTGWGTNFGGHPTALWDGGNGIDENLTRQISEAMKECQKIRPGMTRSELEKVFTTEGGLSTARHRIYVYRPCPYIKVDVDFNLSTPGQDAVEPLPTDTISKISGPYLQWSISD